MIAPLAAADLLIARRAQEALAQSTPDVAQTILLGISPAAMSHPDTLFVAAGILGAQGRYDQARKALDGALLQAPQNPQLWNALGNLCKQLGDLSAAVNAYRKALTIAPESADIWRNLALAAIDQADYDLAESALHQSALHAPDAPELFQIRGTIAHEQGDAEAAEANFRRVLTIKPTDAFATLTLATVLRGADRAEEALAIVNDLGSTSPDALLLRGHLQGDCGRFEEAVADYREALSREPGLVDAHVTLAQLLPQLGRPEEALDSFEQALTLKLQDRALWGAAIVAARDVKQPERLINWAGKAQNMFGADPLFALAGALGEEIAGNRGQAISDMQALAAEWPDIAGIRNHLAPLLLAQGDLEQAQAHALRATELDPHDQSGWAWLSVIWRLMNDPREAWLADYETLVMPVTLSPPAGFSDLAAFLVALRPALEALHMTGFHPADQSLRGGSQTRGNLLERKHPLIGALRSSLGSAIDEQLSRLKVDPSHPFLSRISRRARFAGSWSVRLRSAGFHINHIHHSGWLSSACYIALPPEMHGDPAKAGALAFGVPDETLGLGLTPRRIVTPVEGQLVLFPSYFWHGTIPFESATPRLTVAFDALPA